MIPRILFLLCLLSAAPAFAQGFPLVTGTGVAGEVLPAPLCTYLTNRSDQTIMGTIYTREQPTPDGDNVRINENFRLEAGKRQQICASGPFYEGQRLELVIRTLIPLFDCRTKIDREIFLDAKEDENGLRKLSATCY